MIILILWIPFMSFVTLNQSWLRFFPFFLFVSKHTTRFHSMHIFSGLKWHSFDCISLILILGGESKLAKMARSGSLTARFVNNNYVTAEITYSAAHGRHEILAWSQAALCLMPVRASPQEPSLLWHWGYIGVASWLCYMRLCRGCITAALWLCCGCCQNCCVSQESGCVMAAMPAQRE